MVRTAIPSLRVAMTVEFGDDSLDPRRRAPFRLGANENLVLGFDTLGVSVVVEGYDPNI